MCLISHCPTIYFLFTVNDTIILPLSTVNISRDILKRTKPQRAIDVLRVLFKFTNTLCAHVFRPNILSLPHKNNPKNSTKVDYILFTRFCCRGPHTETCTGIHPLWEMYVNLFSMVPTINWTTLPTFSILWWWNINMARPLLRHFREYIYSTHILVSLAAIQPRNLSSMKVFYLCYLLFLRR